MWASFLILGLFLSGILLAIQRRRWRWWIRAPLALVAGVALTLYVARTPVLLSDSAWYDRSPFKEMSLFLTMILGMACRYVTSAIEERRERIKKLREAGKLFRKPRLEFDAWEFSYPLFVSVVTFGFLLKQVGSDQLSTLNLILSFQNGFFWQTLLQAQTPARSSQGGQ